MDNNAAAVLAAALVGFQNVVTVSRERRIASLSTFSEQVDKDV